MRVGVLRVTSCSRAYQLDMLVEIKSRKLTASRPAKPLTFRLWRVVLPLASAWKPELRCVKKNENETEMKTKTKMKK